MAVTLKRQLSDNEKEKVLEQHGRVCFATGHPITDDESVEFDHIRAFASGGSTEVNNIAPMCRAHNRAKGSLPLYDFRARLNLNDFFSQGDKLTLHDLLSYMKARDSIPNFALPVSIQENGDTVELKSSIGSQELQIYHCPVTNWKYFYATLPIDLLDSDDDDDQSMGLQPRYLIPDKVFELFRHFQRHPVLQPSLGRIVGSHIRLFDGQHKAAAIVWNGSKEIECKVYIESDVRLLNDTNISAHEKFAQTRFYSSIMVMKLGTQFGADFDAYKNLEDGQVKSEAGFVDYFRIKHNLTQGDINNRFRSFLYNSVLEEDDNRLARLVSGGNRPTDAKPITISSLTASLFASFLHRQPTNDNIMTDAYKRNAELGNIVRVMNIIDELSLSQWNPKADASDEGQRKLARLTRSRFMKAWAELLKDVICAQLLIIDQDERVKPLYRDLSDEQVERIKFVVGRLIDWKMWSSPANSEIDQIRLDSDRAVREWLKEKGLTTGYLMGASE